MAKERNTVAQSKTKKLAIRCIKDIATSPQSWFSSHLPAAPFHPSMVLATFCSTAALSSGLSVPERANLRPERGFQGRVSRSKKSLLMQRYRRALEGLVKKVKREP